MERSYEKRKGTNPSSNTEMSDVLGRLGADVETVDIDGAVSEIDALMGSADSIIDKLNKKEKEAKKKSSSGCGCW